MKKNRVNVWVKPVLFAGAFSVALILIAAYIRYTLITADYFKVKDVLGLVALDKGFLNLKGKNIFAINLRSESFNAASSCPDCLRIRLTRILPDRVFVEFIKRKPVASVALYRYFAVDEEGVIFDAPKVFEDSGLPLITGL
jgi:cell division septal protein FtsQ